MTRSYDGHPVEENLARLSGTVPVDSVDAESLLGDSTVVAVIIARVVGSHPQIMKRSGVVRRTDTLEVTQLSVLQPELQRLLEQHLPQLEQPSLADSDWTTEPPVRPVRETVRPDPAIQIAEDDVFEPGGEQRVAVGGARHNDTLLRRFLDGADR